MVHKFIDIKINKMIINYFSLIPVIFLLLIGSNNCPNEQQSNKVEYDHSKKAAVPVLSQKNLFKKNKGQLTIVVKQMKKIIFKDLHSLSDETANKEFIYLGYISVIDNFLIQVMNYESSEYILVSKSGEKVSIWDIPYISDDNKTIVIVSKGIENSATQNGLQILNFLNGEVINTCSINIKVNEPIDVRWNDHNYFVVKYSHLNGERSSVKNYTYNKFSVK